MAFQRERSAENAMRDYQDMIETTAKKDITAPLKNHFRPGIFPGASIQITGRNASGMQIRPAATAMIPTRRS